MELYVGRRRMVLPSRHCEPEDVRAAVRRWNPPFVAVRASGERMFSTRRAVSLECCDVRVECADDGEIGFACKLVAADHNRQHILDDNRACMEETAEMERAAQEFMQAPDDESEGSAQEDEDISIESWAQMGYTWFRNQDTLYI